MRNALKKVPRSRGTFFSRFFPDKISTDSSLDYYYYEHAITDVAERQKKKKIKKRYEEEEIRVLRKCSARASRARSRLSVVFIPGKKKRQRVTSTARGDAVGVGVRGLFTERTGGVERVE